MPQFADFPDQIAHTPVYVVPYFAHDPHREDNTDAQFITLGWSQWDGDEPSAKVVRHSGQRWSRQSEELPLGRLVDLTILTTLALLEGSSFTKIEKGVFENQIGAIDVAHGSKRDRVYLADSLKSDETLKRRLRELHRILNTANDAGALT
jgi:Family of unknown function (DUF6530)